MSEFDNLRAQKDAIIAKQLTTALDELALKEEARKGWAETADRLRQERDEARAKCAEMTRLHALTMIECSDDGELTPAELKEMRALLESITSDNPGQPLLDRLHTAENENVSLKRRLDESLTEARMAHMEWVDTNDRLHRMTLWVMLVRRSLITKYLKPESPCNKGKVIVSAFGWSLVARWTKEPKS